MVLQRGLKGVKLLGSLPDDPPEEAFGAEIFSSSGVNGTTDSRTSRQLISAHNPSLLEMRQDGASGEFRGRNPEGRDREEQNFSREKNDSSPPRARGDLGSLGPGKFGLDKALRDDVDAGFDGAFSLAGHQDPGLTRDDFPRQNAAATSGRRGREGTEYPYRCALTMYDQVLQSPSV